MSESADLAGCLRLALPCCSKGARIINLSFSGGTEANPPLQTAIAAAGAAGALVVVAAGNNGYDMERNATYPAVYSRTMPFVVTVGALDQGDLFPTFSNFDTTSGAPV